jgi:hypothetical protein
MEGFHAVSPKKDCPHCIPAHVAPKIEFEGKHVDDPCCTEGCGHKGENWICLTPGCLEIHCSRYVKSHMVKHGEEKKHPIVFSFADFSYWCYECDAYLEHNILTAVEHFYLQKFTESDDTKE